MEIIRNIYGKLDRWKNHSDRKTLLVRGARQVGKSHAIKYWAKKTFGNRFLEVNFEQNPNFKQAFDGDLSPDSILSKLSLITNRKIEKENFLLFLDEIQRCPQAVSSLRFFYEQLPTLHVIAAGSLLDFILSEISFPVGRVESMYMFPCSFFEFLSAIGKDELRNYLETCSLEKQVEPIAHKLALECLCLYYRIGGMPEAVSAFADTADYKEVSRIHEILIDAYTDDFAKYVKKNLWETTNSVFSSIPHYVCGGRIIYSKIVRDTKAEKIKTSLMLLEKACLLSSVRKSSSAARLPLSNDIDSEHFKLTFLDVGLLQFMLGFDWRNFDLTADLTDVYDGKFAEQFVGQELICARSDYRKHQLHYWERSERNSSAEIDYLIEYDNSVAPLEVKSATAGSIKSLHLYRKAYNPKNSFVVSQRNIEIINDTEYGDIRLLPMYLSARLMQFLTKFPMDT